jgi:hypothetical protein
MLRGGREGVTGSLPEAVHHGGELLNELGIDPLLNKNARTGNT